MRQSNTNVLNAVSCASPGACVAVGYYFNGSKEQTLVEMLLNGSWQVSTSADNTSNTNALNAVACSSPASCVAAGYYYKKNSDQTLVETLAGGSWRLTTSPDQSTYNNVLNAISCTSSGSCVAGGYYSNGSKDQVLVETAVRWCVVCHPRPGRELERQRLQRDLVPGERFLRRRWLLLQRERRPDPRRHLGERYLGGDVQP